MNDDAPLPGRPPPARSSAERDDTVLDWARRTGAADVLVAGLDRHLRRRRRRRQLAGAVAGLALVAAAMLWRPLRAPAPAPAAAAPVAVVETATILRPEQRTLTDGSTVELNAGAEIAVAFGPKLRRVVLRRGEAHFQVAKDSARPFVVTAGAIEVRAVGTGFAVELGSRDVDVLVTEGRITVNATATGPAAGPEAPAAPPPPLAALEAGRRLVIPRIAAGAATPAPTISAMSAADMQARLAWRMPRLKFAATPLAQVVTMFNAHAVPGRDPRLVLAAGSGANARVSGVLRADDVDSLLRLLAAEFGISAERRPGEIVLRSQ